MGCSWSLSLQIFVMLIRSGDICDQIRKLSKNAPNFGRFCPPPNYQYHVCLKSRRLVKSRDVTPSSHKVLGAHTLKIEPNVTCSPLKYLADPQPRLWCALASLGESLAHVKIWGPSTPKGRNVVSRKRTLVLVNSSAPLSRLLQMFACWVGSPT